jgi:hypothetical protein
VDAGVRGIFITTAIITAMVATAAAGQLRVVGDVTTTSISGYAGNQATLSPADDQRVWVVSGVAIRRKGLRACGVSARFWTKSGDDVDARTETFDAGDCEGSKVAAGARFAAPLAIDGVKVCTDAAERAAARMVTGIGLAASTIDDSDDDDRVKDTTRRCAIWHTARKCPSGQHAIGLVVDYRTADGGGYVQGLSLKCAQVAD